MQTENRDTGMSLSDLGFERRRRTGVRNCQPHTRHTTITCSSSTSSFLSTTLHLNHLTLSFHCKLKESVSVIITSWHTFPLLLLGCLLPFLACLSIIHFPIDHSHLLYLLIHLHPFCIICPLSYCFSFYSLALPIYQI